MSRIIRFLISGATVAVINLAVLWLCTELLRVQYLVSVTLAFLVSLPVSFFLQKVWTFKDYRTHIVIAHQSFVYVVVQGASLFLDLGIVYFLVQNGMWYIFAQVIAFVILAVMNFLIFRYLLFAPEVKE